jgi:steroid 5-alpha reductase family enzyme
MLTEATQNRIAAILLVPFLIGVEVTVCKEIAGTLLAIYSFVFNTALMKLVPSMFNKYDTVWSESPYIIILFTILAAVAGEFLTAAQVMFFGLLCLYGIRLSIRLWSIHKITQ